MQVSRDYATPGNDDLHNTIVAPKLTRRISWGAILAGAVIALITTFALYMLGLAIGAATINPAQEIDPVDSALGIGTVVWLAASTLIGLFLGGFTAGRMSGTTDEGDGLIHGLVTWAVVTAITLVMLTTSIGNLINGFTGAFSSTVSSAGQAIRDVAPEVAQAFDLQEETLATIEGEARDFFRAVAVDDSEASVAGQVAENTPLTLEQIQLNREIRSFLAISPDDVTEEDRNALATSIAERSELTVEEARARVDRWETFYVDVREDAETIARDIGQGITDTIVVLAGAIFAAMILGAFGAGAGGYIGTEMREPLLVETHEVAAVSATPRTTPRTDTSAPYPSTT